MTSCVQSFPNKEKMKMNVYDFDNTIYDGESFIDLFIFLFKKDPSLVKYIPDVINGLYKYTKGTINAEEALEQYSDVVTDYYNSIEDFDALVTPDLFSPSKNTIILTVCKDFQRRPVRLTKRDLVGIMV